MYFQVANVSSVKCLYKYIACELRKPTHLLISLTKGELQVQMSVNFLFKNCKKFHNFVLLLNVFTLIFFHLLNEHMHKIQQLNLRVAGFILTSDKNDLILIHVDLHVFQESDV